ncbi:phage capsid protein [Enterococcus thailandicus]|uniref:phage capsid protein n=1 Tax=Enterococcus thailandicus TaxID=417368 RepID=UPI0022E14F6A|nr:phage capsid protein [Enterococcus thailandicus]
MKTREQSIFDEMFKRSNELRYQTYDYKPANSVGYPFVEFEDTQTLHSINKSHVLGNVVIVISVWGLHTKRKQVSEMASALFEQATQVNTSDNYSWSLDTNASDIQTVTDTSTNIPLKRAIIELNFKLIGGI